jgi:hypothetical protein
MAPSLATGDPGSMTVSFLFGWQHILAGLVVLIVVAVIFVVVLAAGRGERSDWQAGLEARSRRHADLGTDLAPDPDEQTAVQAR